MRKYASILILVLIILLIITIIKVNYIGIISTLFIINFIFIIMIYFSKNKIKPFFWTLFFTLMAVIVSMIFVNNNNMSNKYYNNTDNFENIIENIKIQINRKENPDEILNRLREIIQIEESKLNTNDKTSYLRIGQVCELLFTINNDTAWSDCAAKRYDEYCAFDINNSECYYTLAKFMLIDNSRRTEAEILIKKAIELAKTKEEIEKYERLISNKNVI